MRIGFGVDVHRLEKNKPLFIGGVKIPSEKGAVGHSDADVLIHAICDALLGAANLGDIGFHFSDQDPKFKGIDSKILLRNVMVLVKDKGYSVGNIDATVVLEKPKVNPHVPMIKEVLSEILEVNLDDVSIKATTHEKVDSFGNQEAIKSYCVCLLSRNA
ncbi:2-C-methyl-D-erythritol 2,4-cyclodiphosphate synthase [Crocinitomicaceae bacterium]|mgnify:FL=1|nr:2-C-methyl-D-erythritol 2,4-cyclodiphosphate synthase [Crocinitomicaceae bacterium]MDC1244829.1 2-C-methyl-D-erythritol 2,4-cyclodiphosphate synthase [Crocinitomicaceae bacterium]MDO7610219.1 2-C-methyl-D-erythritol 2,4-cyclodiphosphate synthase [Crocinitomicaceae bacterium]MDO7614815.1 2-C-methyl-D-erythritol 2,4-cyclodiphosphate synthase [Crocinitomicaceae bacterium]